MRTVSRVSLVRMPESLRSERNAALENDFLGHGAQYIGNFILWKGVTKYVGIRGGFMAATAAGYTITGDDIVHFPDPATEAIDGFISDMAGAELAPTETLWLPFGYFLEHIHTISTPLAVGELVAFSLIGYGLRRFGNWRSGKAEEAYVKHETA